MSEMNEYKDKERSFQITMKRNNVWNINPCKNTQSFGQSTKARPTVREKLKYCLSLFLK
jgi:hypothetical protein